MIPEPYIAPETLRQRTYQIIFGHEKGAERWFDVALIFLIVASVIVVMLESVRSIRLQYGEVLRRALAECTCPRCELLGHDADAWHCKRCGTRLPDAPPAAIPRASP